MGDRELSVLYHLQGVQEDSISLSFLSCLIQGKRSSIDLLYIDEELEDIDDEDRKQIAKQQREQRDTKGYDDAVENAKSTLQQRIPDAEIRTERGSGDPASEVRQRLNRNHYDLLSLTAYGRGGFRRTILGAHVNKLVQEFPVPVLIHKGSMASCDRILVPVPNDHDRCVKFTTYLADLLFGTDVAVTLLVILSEEHELFEGYKTEQQDQLIDSIEDYNREELEYLGIARKNFSRQGISTEVRGRIGDIAEETLQEAKEGRYDLMAFAPEKASVLSSLWSGDKSLEVIRNIEISPLKFPPAID